VAVAPVEPPGLCTSRCGGNCEDHDEALQPEDISDAVRYIVTRARRVAVNELIIGAAEQSW